MKLLNWFTIAFSLMAFVFYGCFESEDAEEGMPYDNVNATTGFESMEAGSWQELISPDGGALITSFIGTETYNGMECYVMEYEYFGYPKDRHYWMQYWIDKASYVNMATPSNVVVLFLKEDGEVTKHTGNIRYCTIPEGSVQVGKSSYITPVEQIKLVKRTIDCVVYKKTDQSGEIETWVCAKIPFHVVKTLLNGSVQGELQNHAFYGAARGISKEEAKNAKQANQEGDQE